jgi:Domain of unknown function (DUF4291)
VRRGRTQAERCGAVVLGAVQTWFAFGSIGSWLRVRIAAGESASHRLVLSPASVETGQWWRGQVSLKLARWYVPSSSLSHFDRTRDADRQAWSRRLKVSPVRVQWDPERSLRLRALPHRSLQVGLSGEAVDRYITDWTVALTDVTPSVRAIHDLVRAGDDQAASALLPSERPYPLAARIATIIAASADC